MAIDIGVAAFYLIELERIDLLDCKDIAPHLNQSHAITVIDAMNRIGRALVVLIPDNRIIVHRHRRVLCRIIERIADGLRIIAIQAHVAVSLCCLELLVVVVVGIDSVGVHKHRVAFVYIHYQG